MRAAGRITTGDLFHRPVSISLEVLTASWIGTVLAALGAGFWHLAGRHHGIAIAAACAAASCILTAGLTVLVFRPLDRTLNASRKRLGVSGNGRPAHARDQIVAIEEMLGSLIEMSRMGEAATAAESWRDLERLRVQHRQLVEVGDIGQAINTALPYRETVERALVRIKSFLRADFVAVLECHDADQFSIEASLGVSPRSTDPGCCAEVEDCPLRRALGAERPLRTSGHRCTLFPHTMTHQIAVPLAVESVGQMALLATGTTSENFDAVSDDALQALGGHLRTALANAKKYDSIRRQVVTDHLTHLYNRRYFMKRAAEEVERSLRQQTPMSLVLLDIDHFKDFNDRYGHSTGDRVLQAVAAILQDAVRTTDVCARHGGEEFTLLLPATAGDSAMFMATRVRRTLGDTRYTGLGLPQNARITISAGVATCPRDATTVEDLLELADRALYTAKAEGRNRVCQYELERSQRPI